MKHSPIIFSTLMVRAILEGRKTQTRRIVKGFALEMCRQDMFTPKYVAMPENMMCPYGYAGDTLWVRETWARFYIWKPGSEGYGKIVYRSDGEDYGQKRKWKPSIHMPLSASRITLLASMEVEAGLKTYFNEKTSKRIEKPFYL